ncbi:MAG TPA: PAS domain-containing protein [Actinomycetota bacterium]|nr:PAS domain-containing protein [Actinomycetota bacterium]
MVDTARATGVIPPRRNEIIDAVAFAAERLLLAPDWLDAAPEVLARLGRAADVSRAYVLESRPGEVGPIVHQVAEWCAPGIASQSSNPALAGATWTEIGFERWAAVLSEGGVIDGDVRTFPAAEREELAAQDIASTLVLPIRADGEWWGCVGFDECVRIRDWADGEIEAMRAAAALLGAALTRQRQDDRLRRAEERYRSVVEQIPAVTYFDVVGEGAVHLGFVSPQIEALLGYPPERFLAEPDLWFEIVHPEDQERIDAAARAAGSDLAAFDHEYRMRAADGSWVWVHDTTTPVRDEHGRVTHFQGFMIDVTGRRAAEAAVVDAEARYRAVVERLPAVSYVDELPGAPGQSARLSYVSPQIEEVLGYPAERFTGDPGFWFEVMHPDDVERLEAMHAFDASDERPFDEEYRMRHADGHWIWVRDASVAVYAEDGSLAYFQGFMSDVTARHEAEEAAARARARYREVVETIPAVTYVDEPVDGPDGPTARMTFVSPQIEALLGVAAERFVQDQSLWTSLMHPDDLAALRRTGGMKVTNTAPFDAEYRMRHAGGHWVWVHDATTAVSDADGDVAYFQGFVIDVTARREAERIAHEADARFRSLVEQAPAIVYTESVVPGSTRAAAMEYVSPAAVDVLGYPAERWLEDVTFWERIVHPEDAERVAEVMEQVNATGDPLTADYRVIAADGRTVWLHEEARLVRDPDGGPVRWHGMMTDVTERTVAEAHVRAAEERFRLIVEQTPAITYQEAPQAGAYDAMASTVYVSPQVEALLGYTPEEWTAPGFWAQVMHPDDLDEVIALSAATNDSGAPYRQDYRMLAADGRVVWFHDESTAVRDAEGRIISWQGVLIDITERKAAEQRLLDAERVYRATVEHLPATVYREPPHVEQRAADFYISPRVEDLLGYTPDEWRAGIPAFWAEHVHPEDRERVVARNAEVNRTKEPFAEDYRMRRKDGTYVWIRDEATFVPDEQGGWWQGFFLDIGERMATEAQLREAEEMFRSIVERNPAVIYMQEFDAQDGISRTTYVSPRQPEVFGYTAEEVISDPTLWVRTIHPEDRDRVLSADTQSNREERDAFLLEYRMIAKDGRIVWVQDQATLVRVEGRPPFWQGFLLDITERKHAEDQLERALEVEREATRSLRALDDMKNTFLQAVSHDLRTPLAAILGLAITLERGDVHLEEADSKDLARRIATNARRLDRLVLNLLDLDRLARGIVEPKRTMTDVGALVRRVVAESELVSDTRLRTDVRSAMQAVDPAKVERIVENLLANAARHTPAAATIWVSLVPADAGVLLTVEDDGPGIDPALADAIFEPFRQGPDAPQHAPGVGVGLTLVRRFAELHGGRAWVEPRAGGGASFRVFLPADPATADVG